MGKLSKVLLVGVIALAAACGPRGDGVVVGFVIDGQTGQRLNFFEDDGDIKNASDNGDLTNQVYAIIDGEFFRAQPCKTGDANESNKISLEGCYRLEGVPYGEILPIFAQRDGYESFHGSVVFPIPSGDNDDNRQMGANIRMFPRNYSVDYKLFVHMNGRGINDVDVSCQIRQASNSLKTDGDFIEPQNTTAGAIVGRSANIDNTDGVLVIPGTSLVNGATYHCEAFRADLYEGRGVLSGSLDFIAGVDAPEQGLSVSSSSIADNDMLYALFSNADNPMDLLGNNGRLVITFNRPVQIVPETIDCQSYDIQWPGDINNNGSMPPQPPDQYPENRVSEQVQAVPADNVLTIAYKPNGAFPIDPGDTGTSISFSGIYVRPVGDQRIDGMVIRRIGGAGSCMGAAGIAGYAQPLMNVRTNAPQTDTISLF
ncbi:MAG TPA: hypothetical protein DFS52_06160 [Myxococcales bacterium]|nr:hypothetical protein [Myxococcales bacterium]